MIIFFCIWHNNIIKTQDQVTFELNNFFCKLNINFKQIIKIVEVALLVQLQA